MRETRESQCIHATLLSLPFLVFRPGGPEARAPRLEDLEPGREGRGGDGGWTGADGAPAATVCTFLIKLLCCGRRGARLAPINVVLDEEAEELVELLQGASSPIRTWL